MRKFLFDENNNKIEVTDEVGNTTVHEIKCCVSGTAFKKAYVSQAKYNELEAGGLLQPNTEYVITDDTTLDEINAQLVEHSNTLGTHTNKLNQLLQTIVENQNKILELENKHLYKHNIVVYFKNDNQYASNMYITAYTINETKITTVEAFKSYVTGKTQATGFVRTSSASYNIINVSQGTDINGNFVFTVGYEYGNTEAGAQITTSNITSINDYVLPVY